MNECLNDVKTERLIISLVSIVLPELTAVTCTNISENAELFSSIAVSWEHKIFLLQGFYLERHLKAESLIDFYCSNNAILHI